MPCKPCNCPPPWEQVARLPASVEPESRHLSACAHRLIPTWWSASSDCWRNTRQVLKSLENGSNPGPLFTRSHRFPRAYLAASARVVRQGESRPVEEMWDVFLFDNLHHWPVCATIPRFCGGSRYSIRTGPWWGCGVSARTSVLALPPGAVVLCALAQHRLLPHPKTCSWKRPNTVSWTVHSALRITPEGAVEQIPTNPTVFVGAANRYPKVAAIRAGRYTFLPGDDILGAILALR